MAEPQDWEVLSQTTMTDQPPWLRVVREHVRLPNGSEIPDYYRIEMKAYVEVFALTHNEQVVVVELYKHGPGVVSLELPAGYIESDADHSDPILTAQRELLEETGMVAENWSSLGKFFIDGNRGCGWMYGFLATGAVQQQMPDLEPTEVQNARLLPLDAVRKLWLDGTINNVASSAIIGLALARLQKDE